MIFKSLLLSVTLATSIAPDPDPWFAEDKLKHFFTSFVVTSLSASSARVTGLDRTQATFAGVGVGLAAGLYKEIRDVQAGGFFSARDLVWDIGGVGGAAALMEATR